MSSPQHTKDSDFGDRDWGVPQYQRWLGRGLVVAQMKSSLGDPKQGQRNLWIQWYNCLPEDTVVFARSNFLSLRHTYREGVDSCGGLVHIAVEGNPERNKEVRRWNKFAVHNYTRTWSLSG